MSQIFDQLPRLKNSQPIPLAQVPVLDFASFRDTVVERAVGSTRLAAFFGHPLDADSRIRVFAVLADAEEGDLLPLAADLTQDAYPSLTPDCPQAHNFERELAEQWGVVPDGHPWLKPLRYHHSYRPGHDAWSRAAGEPILPCVTDYFRVDGPEVHEVAVGPVHAGVIEPGSFRFQCHGEQVFHLEIHLGYQHRGVERRLIGGPDKRTLHYMETLAGDTTIGHATAYCQAVEGLAGAVPSQRASAIRSITLELERLACHTGDLGALADDVGYLPTANFCGRLRGDFLNATGVLCGNRFGRSLVRPGGVTFDIDADMSQTLIDRLQPALRDVGGAVQLLWNSQTVRSRFENTGVLRPAIAEALGIVGVAQRASGMERDVRQDFPSGFYRVASIPVAVWPAGDVFARAYVRWLEIERSGQFAIDHLHTLPHGPLRVDVGPLAPESLVVSLVEGWRGAICHVAMTDAEGRFARYKVVDPSFQNWIGLAMVLRDQQISDFPLCNKSFNLSYCGHDLYRPSLMFQLLAERFQQGYRTAAYPEEPAPPRPGRFRGLPILDQSKCPADCDRCLAACPTDALRKDDGRLQMDLGRCLFCTDCAEACPEGTITFTDDYRLSTRSRADLLLGADGLRLASELDRKLKRLFGRSLKLRQVSAGGCNACEADVNVLNTIVFDLSRFGIQFVASPRHADGLLITGPVTTNMQIALQKTYDAVPSPKIVIAVGACAISGGPYVDHPEARNGADQSVPVDLYIPGCPPSPWTILDGLLRLLGRLETPPETAE